MHGFKPRENNLFAKFKKENEVPADNAADAEMSAAPAEDNNPEFAEILTKYSHDELAQLRDMIDEELAEGESDAEHAEETADDEMGEHGDDSEI